MGSAGRGAGAGAGEGAGRDPAGGGATAQPEAKPRMAAVPTAWIARAMWLLIVEALAAAALLVFIVWWTMFSGRKGGEIDRDEPPSR